MEYTLLDRIQNPSDLKKLNEDQLPALCEEIRSYMIETISRTGGHLASALGAVELIVAMHYVFDSPYDKLIFDVGHQAYAHKILTGRREAFASIRTEGGISGFPKREESEHDVFNTGHASTAISAALGYARAMRLRGEDGISVALVGDGAMTGGMSFEAMDDAGNDKVPLIVILNDNEMSISKNVGALTRSFAAMRTGRTYLQIKRGIVHVLDMSKIGKWLSLHMERVKNRVKHFLLPDLPFEELGFTYIGPVDGHDIKTLIRYMRRLRELQKPVILHAITQKGRGYAYASEDPERFHGIAPFCVTTGETNGEKKKSCSEVFGETLVKLAEQDPRIVAVTAAMPSGTGLSTFAKRFPEEHAVTMSAALAAGGMRPVAAIYSSFLQRGYDQLLHDVCLQNLPVVIGVDRAGLVGADGETHQGVYDPAFLMTIPNLAIYSPATMDELRGMLAIALQRNEPAAIRYNRGSLPEEPVSEPIAFGKWQIVLPVRPVTILATGTMLPLAKSVAEKNGAGLVHIRFFKPMDEELLERFSRERTKLLVIEENVAAIAPQIALRCNVCAVRSVAIPDQPIAQGSVPQQRDRYGLNAENITRILKEMETT